MKTFSLSILFLLPLGFIFGKENKRVSIPLPDSILQNLYKPHPRLLAHSEDFERLKNALKADETLKTWDAKLIEEGDKIVQEPVSKYEIPDGLRLLSTSREVVQRVYTLAMLYRLHEDKKYAERAWSELDAASKFPDWNPKHFLDVGEMTHAFAIGYDWLFDYWVKERREILKSAIMEKGLSRAMLAYQDLAKPSDAWWPKESHNWNQVCNGGIGIGALAIADEEPKYAEFILKNVILNLPIAMKTFAPDGASIEGPGYWSYATQYNVMILAALESSLKTDFGLGKIEGFAKTAVYPAYLSGPFFKSFNYADGSDSPAQGSQLFWLASKYNQPFAAIYQKQLVKKPHALDLLWYQPQLLNSNTTLPPKGAYYRHAEVVSMRSEWNNSNAFFVGFKAGDNKANHSNLDLGSFVLDALGKRWVVDLGADNYNLPGYFETKPTGKRWTYYRMRAEGHNTLVINPDKNADQDPLAETKISGFKNAGNTSFAIADLTPAYIKNAEKFRRGVALARGKTVVIQDEVKTKNPATVYWFIHTPAKININGSGKNALLTIEDKKLEARIISPANAAFSILPAVPLASSPHPEGISKNDGIQRLSIKLEGVKEERIIVEFTEAGKAGFGKKFYERLNNWK